MDEIQEGDVVRPAGWSADMVVVIAEHPAHEGIFEGAMCSWSDETGEHEAVFPREGMTIVKRAPA